MIRMEERVAASLRARVDRQISADGLRVGALARARRIGRRRRLAGAATAVGLAVLVAGAVAAPRLLAGGGPPTRPTTPVYPLTTLPAVPDAPTAGADPGAVGSDPAVLHFDVDLAALDAETSSWTSEDGYEWADIRRVQDRPEIEIYLGKYAITLNWARQAPGAYWFTPSTGGGRVPRYREEPEEPVLVGGRPGTLQKVVGTGAPIPADSNRRKYELEDWNLKPDAVTWVLRWQPAPGLHAIVQARGIPRARAFAAAAALRVDRAQACAMPLRLTAVPAGNSLRYCRTTLRTSALPSHGVWTEAVVSMGTMSAPITVFLGDARRPRDAADDVGFVPNRTVAGHPAMWDGRGPEPHRLWVKDAGGTEITVYGADEPEAVRVVEGMRQAGDPARAATWPTRVVN